MKIDTSYSWSTHLPLLQSVLQHYDIHYALEVGVGLHSTSFLNKFKDVLDYTGVENDYAWYSKMIEKYPDLRIIYQDLGGISKNTLFSAYSSHDRTKLYSLYQIMAENACKDVKKGKNGVLFVDGFAGTRKPALECLKDGYNFIIFHDTQQRSNRYYNYADIDWTGFALWDLTSPTAWTTIAIKEGVDLTGFTKIININTKRYLKNNPQAKPMKLQKSWM